MLLALHDVSCKNMKVQSTHSQLSQEEIGILERAEEEQEDYFNDTLEQKDEFELSPKRRSTAEFKYSKIHRPKSTLNL